MGYSTAIVVFTESHCVVSYMDLSSLETQSIRLGGWMVRWVKAWWVDKTCWSIDAERMYA